MSRQLTSEHVMFNHQLRSDIRSIGWHVVAQRGFSGRGEVREQRRNSVWIKARELQETFGDTLTSNIHPESSTRASALRNESKTPNSYPDQVTDSSLHGGHGSGEIRDGFPVHLSLLVHDDQMRDLLGHRLQDTLYRLRVKNRHDELLRERKPSFQVCIQTPLTVSERRDCPTQEHTDSPSCN